MPGRAVPYAVRALEASRSLGNCRFSFSMAQRVDSSAGAINSASDAVCDSDGFQLLAWITGHKVTLFCAKWWAW